MTHKRNLLREKSLKKALPDIDFRKLANGREAFVRGHRLAVWEVAEVHEQTKSIAKTARHLRLPVSLVRSVLTYATAHRSEIEQRRSAEIAK